MLLQRIEGQLQAQAGLPGESQGGEEPDGPGAVADQLSVLSFTPQLFPEHLLRGA